MAQNTVVCRCAIGQCSLFSAAEIAHSTALADEAVMDMVGVNCYRLFNHRGYTTVVGSRFCRDALLLWLLYVQSQDS